MTDIGNMTYGIRDNTTDLAEIWVNAPWRRGEFGEREIADLRASLLKISLLLSAIEAKGAGVRQIYRLDVSIQEERH